MNIIIKLFCTLERDEEDEDNEEFMTEIGYITVWTDE